MKIHWWSSSQVNTANYCRRRYYLNYIDPDKPKPLRLSVYVKGSLLHQSIEKFWDRLGTPEEVAKKSSGKKYYDAESFADYLQRQWKRIIIADSKSEEKISWGYENEKYVTLNQLPLIVKPLFQILLDKGPPLFSELAFKFIAYDEGFTGRIDEIRLEKGKIKIIDFKSGDPWVDDIKKDFDPQLSLYNPGLRSICAARPDIADKLGLDGKLIAKEMQNGHFVDPNIEEMFFMIEAPRVIDLLKEKELQDGKPRKLPLLEYITHRQDAHFYGVVDMVKGIKQLLSAPNIIYGEWGKKCRGCDMKIACREKSMQTNTPFTDKKGQQYFNLTSPNYGEREIQPSLSQKKFRLLYKRGGIKTGLK